MPHKVEASNPYEDVRQEKLQDSSMVRSNDRYDKYCEELCDEFLDDVPATTDREHAVNEESKDDADQTEMDL